MAPHAEAIPEVRQVSSGKMASLQSSAAQQPPRVEGTSDTTGTTIPDPVLQTQPTKSRFTHHDVLPLRSKAKQPMAKGVAPFSSADLFKSESALAKSKASTSYMSHLTAESRARQPSSLKGAMKYFKPATISLCGGLPSSEYFPFEELAFEVPTPATGFSATEGTKVLRARKHDIQEGKSAFDLSVCLNYGQSMGPPQLMRYLTEHTEIVHNPPYSNWDICLTQGSTSALDLSFRMFCARGDALLTEEYSFSSAIETAIPMGLAVVGIKMDGKGLCPKDLKYVLSNWDEGDCLGTKKYGGAKRPKVMYTVPTGQNPTGATQDTERRKAILKICEEYKVFILEDEPYYFLQMEEYVSKAKHTSNTNGQHTNGHSEQESSRDLGDFVEALTPSYLSLSSTGNVLRLDSFSKILAPGSRTGWVTGPADIVERFIRASEVSAQTPSGFTMMALYKLLDEEWGHEGFLQWLQKLRAEYTWRRDGIVEACESYLPTEIVQFEAPMAGMFHWLRVDGSKHPMWIEQSQSQRLTEGQTRALLEKIEEKVFVTATEYDVLVARGSWFRAEKKSPQAQAVIDAGPTAVQNGAAEKFDTTIYFRMTFAAAPMDKIEEAVKRFGNALRAEFEL